MTFIHQEKILINVKKDRHKTVGGDVGTMYPLAIHFDGICARNMIKFKMRKKVIKNNLRIISKSRSRFPIKTKIPV